MPESRLLTDEEFAAGPGYWYLLEDPFANTLDPQTSHRSTEVLAISPPDLLVT